MVLDPSGRATKHQHTLAPRIHTTLDGVRVELLSNSKRNSAELLDAVADLLSERYELQTVTRHVKPSESLPVPNEMADEIAANSDIVITAIGD